MSNKVVFIAYSHDSDEHKVWVKKFADDLEQHGGFEILLDQNLPKGSSLSRFMTLGLSRADKVLIIGTPIYKQKSETGKGAAFEGTIISTEMMQDVDTCKFYPILRAGSFEKSFPSYLQGRIGDDLSDDSKYDDKLKEVVGSIKNEKTVPASLSGERKANHNMQFKSVKYTKNELNEIIDKAETNLPIVKEKIKKIKQELPYLESGQTCIMTRMRIAGIMNELPMLVQQIRTCVVETDDFGLAGEIINNILPVWNECVEYAKRNNWFPWNEDAKGISEQLAIIGRWFKRNS